MRAWDYNEDGIDDSRELPGPAARRSRSFPRPSTESSTSGSSGGDPQSSASPGRERSWPSRRTRVRGVTWVGRPAPAGARPDLSQPDGVQMLGARQYLLFRHEGIIYAEAMK